MYFYLKKSSEDLHKLLCFFSTRRCVYPIQSQLELRHHFHIHVVPTVVAFERKKCNFEFCRGWQAQKPKFRAQTPFPCPGCDHCCCYIIDCLSPQVSNLFPCDTCLTAVLWQWESGISWLHYSLKLQFPQWQCIVWVSSRPAQNSRVLKWLKNDCDWVPWQWAWWEPKTMEDCGLLWLTVNYVTMNWWPICEVRCISLRCESM